VVELSRKVTAEDVNNVLRAASEGPLKGIMGLVDKPGALAKVAAALGEAGVSIERMRQYGHADLEAAQVLIVTHKTTRASLDVAIAAMEGTGVLASAPVALRIEHL